MRTFIIIIGSISAIYFAIKIKDWKLLNRTEKLFSILAIIAALGSGIYIFLDLAKGALIDEARNYLNENRARLTVFLHIDEVKSDTVYYHLEIKNTNPIAAKNIVYYCDINKQFSRYESKELESEIGKDESISIYTPLWISPAIIDNVDFSVRIFLYYDSIWERDTLKHQEKFTFIIPEKILSAKKYSPTEKIVNDVKSIQEILYDKTIESLNEKVGSLEFVIRERDQRDSITYILNTDSIKLIYDIPQQEILFHRMFEGEQLLLRKNLKKYIKKGYHVVLTWNNNDYNLYVNADSAEIRIINKYTLQKGESTYRNKSI